MEAPHNIRYLRVSGEETFCFFETWRPEWGSNPPFQTFQAGSFNHYTRAPAPPHCERRPLISVNFPRAICTTTRLWSLAKENRISFYLPWAHPNITQSRKMLSAIRFELQDYYCIIKHKNLKNILVQFIVWKRIGLCIRLIYYHVLHMATIKLVSPMEIKGLPLQRWNIFV